MNMDEVKAILAEYTALYGEIEPERLPQVLYDYYAETCPLEDPQVWACHQALRESLAHLAQPEQESILECAAALANAQEKAAFLAAFTLAHAAE